MCHHEGVIGLKRLTRSFFEQDTLTVAKELLGTYIVKEINGKVCVGKIVETEAYTGINDKASHAYGNRRTNRTEVMYGKAGCAYIYLIYGMYHLLNIVTNKENEPECVLIRAIEPIKGIEEMMKARFKQPMNVLSPSKQKQLSNGPGKLCQALSITKEMSGYDLCAVHQTFFYLLDKKEQLDYIQTTRINIDYAEEAKNYLYRFYEKDNPFVSVKT